MSLHMGGIPAPVGLGMDVVDNMSVAEQAANFEYCLEHAMLKHAVF